MCDLSIKSLWEIDNLNSLEGTSLDAHTTSNAQLFRDKADLTGFSDVNTLFTCLVNGTRFAAFLITFLWLALISIDNSDSQLFSIHLNWSN